MDSQSALALIDESADRPPMKGDSQRLSQGLQAKYRDRITGIEEFDASGRVVAPGLGQVQLAVDQRPPARAGQRQPRSRHR